MPDSVYKVVELVDQYSVVPGRSKAAVDWPLNL